MLANHMAWASKADFVKEPPKIFRGQKTQNFGDFLGSAHKWQHHCQMQIVIENLKQ